MSAPVLGIITLYNNSKRIIGEELRYFEKVILEGKKLGLDLIVFTPEDVNHSKRRIYSHRYDTERGRWFREWSSFPAVIYDRCRYQGNDKFALFRRFRGKYNRLIYLNRPLANKWVTYQVLAKSESIRPHLPLTKKYSVSDLLHLVKSRTLLYLKPISGTGGRGILRIDRLQEHSFLIQGRDRNRKIIPPQKMTLSQLPYKLKNWGVNEKYLIQQGIPLRMENGRVHDYRLLIQKDGGGEWNITGCAGRIGAPRSVTSNLHGGGKAVPMDTLLSRRFASSPNLQEKIKTQVSKLSYDVARFLEEQFGQLCELGLDIAIDPRGEVWLLEINPKPAREVFSRIGEWETYRKALSRPLEYGLWLYKQKKSD